MGSHKWNEEGRREDRIKIVSKTKIRDLGLMKNPAVFVNTLEELRENPSNIVLAQSLKEFKFTQNYFKQQTFEKKCIYVMGLGVYQQLHGDKLLGKKKFLKPASIKFKNVYRPYIGQDLTDKILLVFRTGGIGDLLFIQPNLYYLKKKYPTCYIKFACGPQYQNMVETWDCIDEVLDLPFKFDHLRESDYHALFEGVIERCNLAKTVNSYNLFSKWLGLDLPDELLVPKQEPKEDKIQFCKDKLNEWNIQEKGFILMQVRASSPVRTLPPQFSIEMINQLTEQGYNIVLTDSPHQSDKVDQFISKLKFKERVFNFCKFSKSLDYSIALIKLANMVVGTDSSMLHIAASLNKKLFGLYGPFLGEIRLKTYPKAMWINAKKECSPCFLHGQKPCRYASIDGYSLCYNNIDINQLVEKIKKFYEEDND